MSLITDFESGIFFGSQLYTIHVNGRTPLCMHNTNEFFNLLKVSPFSKTIPCLYWRLKNQYSNFAANFQMDKYLFVTSMINKWDLMYRLTFLLRGKLSLRSGHPIRKTNFNVYHQYKADIFLSLSLVLSRPLIFMCFNYF